MKGMEPTFGPRRIDPARMEQMMNLEQQPDPEEWEAMFAEIKRRGIEVIETNKDTFPQDLNQSGLEGLSDRAWENYVALTLAARRYWSGYIVKDHFEKDDVARAQFQTEMGDKFRKTYDLFQAKNKLRISPQTALHGMFRNIVAEFNRAGVTSPEANKIREIYVSLFPAAAIGFGTPELFIRDPETLKQIKKVGEQFPGFPDIRDARDYRTYFLDLTEPQRLQIVASFDKAAHDFLEMATRPAGERLAESVEA
jgi:hypothetical protein